MRKFAVWLSVPLTRSAAILPFVFAAGTWWETKIQADIQMIGARPFVLVQIDHDELSLNQQNNEQGLQLNYSGHVTLVNFGSTPAIIREFRGNITTMLPDSAPDVVETHTTDLILANREASPPKTFSRPVYEGEMYKLTKDGLSLYIHGEVTYVDIVGVAHHTWFCYQQPTNGQDYRHGIQRATGVNCFNKID